jgi:tripartite-type tricarboxylate transporter receptor subunit TctC
MRASRRTTSNFRILALALIAFTLLPASVLAQSFPSRPVQMVVAFPPGSSTDVIARLVAAKLSASWGQQVVAENRAGAGGSIASAVVARAKPDGYTLLVNSNAHAINLSTMATLPYDTLKDFTEIAPLTIQPNVLAVAANSPYKTLGDYVQAAKTKPNAVTLAHAGVGSGTHLHAERFIAASGIQVNVIPFKGTAEIVAAMLGGNIDSYWLPISAGISQIRAGKLRGLAMGADKRSPLLPEVPTTAEAGVPNADVSLWFGVWGPAGMPEALVNQIAADVRKVLAEPDMREKLVAIGSETMSFSPQEFARFVRAEIDENRRLLQRAGVKPQ